MSDQPGQQDSGEEAALGLGHTHRTCPTLAEELGMLREIRTSPLLQDLPSLVMLAETLQLLSCSEEETEAQSC